MRRVGERTQREPRYERVMLRRRDAPICLFALLRECWRTCLAFGGSNLHPFVECGLRVQPSWPPMSSATTASNNWELAFVTWMRVLARLKLSAVGRLKLQPKSSDAWTDPRPRLCAYVPSVRCDRRQWVLRPDQSPHVSLPRHSPTIGVEGGCGGVCRQAGKGRVPPTAMGDFTTRASEQRFGGRLHCGVTRSSWIQ